jgi:PleD family two-component response regulator
VLQCAYEDYSRHGRQNQRAQPGAEYLEAEGFHVVIASNGREALYAARHEKPDLILLDIMMPEISGYKFIKAYRKERETPITLLTTRLDEMDKVLGLKLGADDHVTKPFRRCGGTETSSRACRTRGIAWACGSRLSASGRAAEGADQSAVSTRVTRDLA